MFLDHLNWIIDKNEFLSRGIFLFYLFIIFPPSVSFLFSVQIRSFDFFLKKEIIIIVNCFYFSFYVNNDFIYIVLHDSIFHILKMRF